MKYISLGSSCVPAMLMQELNIKNETLPFDWVSHNLKIIIDCLITDFVHFNKMGDPKHIIDVNEDVREFNKLDCPNFSKDYINHYNTLFVHDTHLSPEQFQSQLQRRVSRFLEILQSDEKIVFIYTNEPGTSQLIYYENQQNYYHDLITIQNILITKFRKTNFVIIGFFVDADKSDVFPETKYVKPICVKWDKKIFVLKEF
jgi:Putative papain-like cysteine peptidase (DUF1796).